MRQSCLMESGVVLVRCMLFDTSSCQKKKHLYLSFCFQDNDCQSDRCDNQLTCRPKSEEGEGCLENNDCKAGQCSWMLTCGETTCAYDSSCPTGRCSKWLMCELLLKNGEGCFEGKMHTI